MQETTEANETSLVEQQDLEFLATAMNKKYALYLEGRSFSIKNWLGEDGVYVCVTLANSERSFVYPVAARMKYQEEELTLRRAALFLVDYIDTYFEEYWEELEDLFIPIDWSDFEYDTVKFQMRGQIINEKVEAMAEEFLKKAEAVPAEKGDSDLN